MILESAKLLNFRCYESVELFFDSRFNTIIGKNGQGKTSILEAIYLLSTLKSFRLARNPELIRNHGDAAAIIGVTSHEGLKNTLQVRINQRLKHSTINGKSCKLLSEYMGKLSAVTFSPSDLEIIRGVPEFRRTWVDRIATIFDPQHIDFCSRYTKVLNHRNKELKKLAQGQIYQLPDDFEVWTAELVRLGAQVIHNRIGAVDKLRPAMNQFYRLISGTDDFLDVQYASDAFEGFDAGQQRAFSLDLLSQFLTKELNQLAARERAYGSTLVGPHRDDLKMMFNGNLLKAYGSQGEVRSTVLAMRLAEVQSHREVSGIDPLLLIDDFSSELDSQRREFLLNYLCNIQSQIFLSTTEDLTMGKVFNVHAGKVTVNGN